MGERQGAIEELLDGVSNIRTSNEAARLRYDPLLAIGFNIFDFIDADEMKLSRILAWLLNPQASHAQSHRFLDLFLESIGLPAGPNDWGALTVNTEVHTDQGRLDILVSGPNLKLIIENKPFAGDQPGQLQRYFGWLNGQQGPKRLVVYLTSEGRDPSNESLPKDVRQKNIDAGHLRLASYTTNTRVWLQQCLAVCKANRVSHFICEFMSYIDRRFNGMGDDVMGENIRDAILQTPERVHASLIIATRMNDVKRALFERLKAKIEAELSSEAQNQIKVRLNPPIAEIYGSLTISFVFRSDFIFSLEFQSGGYRNLIFGIKRAEQIQPPGDDAIYRQVCYHLGNGKWSRWWLWYRGPTPQDNVLPIAQDWQNDPAPWVALATDERPANLVVSAYNRACYALINPFPPQQPA